MSVMDIKGLTFAYPNGKEILHGIDLEIGEGEFVLLCGPSGCGKTTLLRCMKAEIAPIGERKGSVTKRPAKEIGYVFQNPDNQIVTDTVRHELAFGLENIGLPTEVIRRRVAETALFFGIDEWIDASVHEISGGQKQLLNLASVIAMRPKLLLLDSSRRSCDLYERREIRICRRSEWVCKLCVNKRAGVFESAAGSSADRIFAERSQQRISADCAGWKTVPTPKGQRCRGKESMGKGKKALYGTYI